jgi:hypothetical protein
VATKLAWLQSAHNWHWPNKCKRLCLCQCSAYGKVTQIAKYEAGLCMYSCFQDYHTKLNLRIFHSTINNPASVQIQ